MWNLPDSSLLSKSDNIDTSEQMEQAARLGDLISERTDELGSRLNVEDISIGPQTIKFDCVPVERTLVRLLPRFAAELQYELAVESVRILAPVPGHRSVGIEINNPNRRTVLSGDVISSARNPLLIPLGINSDNETVTADIKEFPHCLIAGQTGAGKSVGLHHIISSLLTVTTPDKLLFNLVDTKLTELTMYEGIPNLICPVVTDAWDALANFKALVEVMEERYKIAQRYNSKTLDELNSKLPPGQKLPYILVVVDEISDLMFLSKHAVEESVIRIAQKARAVGIHLILATQSPRREVVTGLLKCNLSSRIAFSTSSELDSRIIIDKNGAGQLTGAGDALFSLNGTSLQRIQVPLISSSEIMNICEHWKGQQYWNEKRAA